MKRNQISELKPISNYLYENIFNVHKDKDGMYYYNLYNTLQFDGSIASNFYREHVVSSGDYWTKLSRKYYGSTELWWLICVVNNIVDPFSIPEPGTVLKILNQEIVGEIVTEIQLNG